MGLGLSTVYADVHLTDEQRDQLGIAVTSVAAAQAPRSYSAVASVIDIAPLVRLLSDLRAAEAAVVASRNELARAEQLHAADGNIATKAVEAAKAQSLSDVAHLDGLRAQLMSEWGPALANWSAGKRERLIQALLKHRAVLLRAEATSIPFRARISDATLSDLANDAQLPAQALGRIAEQSSQGLSPTFLLRVDASPNDAMQTGALFDAVLHDAHDTVTGVKVPRSALVRWEGQDWVFVAQDDTYARRLVHPVEWLKDGCLVQDELKVGERVVTTGATWLLGAESAPAPQDD